MFGFIGGVYRWNTTVTTTASTSKSTSRSTTTSNSTSYTTTEGQYYSNNYNWYQYGNPKRGTLRWAGSVIVQGSTGAGGSTYNSGGYTYIRGSYQTGNSFYAVSRSNSTTRNTSVSTTTTFNTTYNTSVNTQKVRSRFNYNV